MSCLIYSILQHLTTYLSFFLFTRVTLHSLTHPDGASTSTPDNLGEKLIWLCILGIVFDSVIQMLQLFVSYPPQVCYRLIQFRSFLGLKLRSCLPPLLLGPSPSSSRLMRSSRLREGYCTRSKREPPDGGASLGCAGGRRVKRIGWPLALAPSNCLIASEASSFRSYVTKAVPSDRPARSYRSCNLTTGPILRNNS